MPGRSFRIALLVFQALWLNAIVPGHRRGIVSLPGEGPSSCHETIARKCCGHGGGCGREKAPGSGDPALHCSICYFAARVTCAAPVNLTPAPLRLLEFLPPESAPVHAAIRLSLPYDGRAPPSTRHV